MLRRTIAALDAASPAHLLMLLPPPSLSSAERLCRLEARGRRLVDYWCGQPPKAPAIAATLLEAGSVEHPEVRRLAWALEKPHMAARLDPRTALDVAVFAVGAAVGGSLVSQLCYHRLLPALAQGAASVAADVEAIPKERVLEAFTLCLSCCPHHHVLPPMRLLRSWRNATLATDPHPRAEDQRGATTTTEGADGGVMADLLPDAVSQFDIDGLVSPVGDNADGCDFADHDEVAATTTDAAYDVESQHAEGIYDPHWRRLRLLTALIRYAPARDIETFVLAFPDGSRTESLNILAEVNRRLDASSTKPTMGNTDDDDGGRTADAASVSDHLTLVRTAVQILEPLTDPSVFPADPNHASSTVDLSVRQYGNANLQCAIKSIRESNFAALKQACVRCLTTNNNNGSNGSSSSDSGLWCDINIHPVRHGKLLATMSVLGETRGVLKGLIALQAEFDAPRPLPWNPHAWSKWMAASLALADGTAGFALSHLLQYALRHTKAQRLESHHVPLLVTCAAAAVLRHSIGGGTYSSTTMMCASRLLDARTWHRLLATAGWASRRETSPAVLGQLVEAIGQIPVDPGTEASDSINRVASHALKRCALFAMKASVGPQSSSQPEYSSTSKAETLALRHAATNIFLTLATTRFQCDEYTRALDLSLIALRRIQRMPTILFCRCVRALAHRQLSVDAATAILLHPDASTVVVRCFVSSRLQALAVAAHYRISCRSFTWAVLDSLVPHLGRLTLHELGLVCMAATNTVYDSDAFSVSMEAAVRGRVSELAADPVYGGGSDADNDAERVSDASSRETV